MPGVCGQISFEWISKENCRPNLSIVCFSIYGNNMHFMLTSLLFPFLLLPVAAVIHNFSCAFSEMNGQVFFLICESMTLSTLPHKPFSSSTMLTLVLDSLYKRLIFGTNPYLYLRFGHFSHCYISFAISSLFLLPNISCAITVKCVPSKDYIVNYDYVLNEKLASMYFGSRESLVFFSNILMSKRLLFENRPALYFCNYKENKMNNIRMLDTLFIEDFIDSMEEYFHF